MALVIPCSQGSASVVTKVLWMSSASAFYVAVHLSEQERGKVYKETTLLGNRAAAEICREIEAGGPAGVSDPSKSHACLGSFEHSAIWRCCA